jgi:hypothetical protein
MLSGYIHRINNFKGGLAWKITSMSVPVVLVYLGFVGATEVSDLGKPFVDGADWTRVVLGHSRGIVPEGGWGGDIKVGGVAIRPLIRIWKQEIPASEDVLRGFRQKSADAKGAKAQ